MRRLPPQQIEKNLSDLIDLVSSDVVEAVRLYNLGLCLRIIHELLNLPHSQAQTYLYKCSMFGGIDKTLYFFTY